MQNVKINITYQCFVWQQPFVSNIIKKCIMAALSHEGVCVPCEINVLITDDDGIQAINKAYRNIDRPTDVLSFPMFQLEPGSLPEDWTEYMDPGTNRCPLGDMAISYGRAVAQSKEFGHSARRELGYLTIHSMLHLLGYDHMDDGPEKARMREREEQIASSIPNMQRI